jgi:Protein of unknown function (DUF4007)
MGKLTFSGHESFQCRSIWLNKGYNFLANGNNFNQEDSMVELGVGKNMVSSINYWLNVFKLTEKNNNLSKLADFIFGKNGVDPYLEDITTLWLLHYHLVTENIASIYSLVFNDFRKHRIEFNKNQLLKYIEHKCSGEKFYFNENTVSRDIMVFLHNYVRPGKVKNNLSELFSGLFLDLNLIEPLKKFDEDEFQWYKIENKERKDIPCELILYSILSNNSYGTSISFDDLQFGDNSSGNVFAINPKGLLDKISEITNKYKGITFKDDAGIREFQHNNKLSKWEVLKNYYEK